MVMTCKKDYDINSHASLIALSPKISDYTRLLRIYSRGNEIR